MNNKHITINKADLLEIVNYIIKESYDLPVELGPREDVTIKRNLYDQTISDLYKAIEYFSMFKIKNDPEFSDRFNRLNRAYKNLAKSTQKR